MFSGTNNRLKSHPIISGQSQAAHNVIDWSLTSLVALLLTLSVDHDTLMLSGASTTQEIVT